MSVSIPTSIRENLISRVSRLAEEHGYLNRTAAENNQFMSSLIKDPEVGGRVAEFVGKIGVKTYIKDSLLRKYAQRRRRPSKQTSEYLRPVAPGIKLAPLTSSNRTGVDLYRLEDGGVAAAAFTSYRKWETGLRKLLQFVAARHSLADERICFYLIIFDPSTHVIQSDRELVGRALRLIGVEPVWGNP